MDIVSSATIRIITLSEGVRSVFASDATYDRTTDGFHVCYAVEGDCASLLWDGKVLRMERRGEAEIFADFVEGQQTYMSLVAYEGQGSIPVKTFRLRVHDSGNKLVIKLFYDLLFEKSSKHFHLDISISN